MRLLKFTASNVYGYINFNIKFNKDVSFLVGANGSGKSTAIKLIQATFSLNFKELILIPFEKNRDYL
ncbi:AAA family ATPase [Klebsiella aerogenes]|uniref:AAA family ATPase n=1 Tax=Klebsiella aerogenes TaxID=548 RepID=UPI0029DE0730|nr:AAA family ATPase [Klebsiella aerogenes]MDX7184539.1 AAA family ATPase [Klebsiella aerogenes]